MHRTDEGLQPAGLCAVGRGLDAWTAFSAFAIRA